MNSTKRTIGLVLLAASVGGCAADRLHKDGIAAIEHGSYEEGVAQLKQAVKLEPSNLTYRIDLRSREELAIQQLVSAGDSARAAGKADAAEASYRRVLAIEPSNDRAQRGLDGVALDRAHAARVSKAEAMLARKDIDGADMEIRGVLTEDPGFGPARVLSAKIDAARGPVTVSPKLKTIENRPVTLQFRDAPTKMVFEVLARQTGINFIFDKDIKSDGKTTIFATQIPVEQAIDLILSQNQLGRQVLSGNMVLVYPNTPAKQKDYQDEIVRTFYLSNAAPKDAESLLKTVLGAKTLFIDERASVVVMRDTPEHVRMAEKLIATLDMPDSEVMLEVEVLEITRNTLDQVGFNYPTSFGIATTATGQAASTVKTTSTSSSSSPFVLADIAKQTSRTLTATPLSLSLDLLKQTGLTNVLASPRIRARNKEKAKVLIGDRVPVITSGTTATTGGAYSTSNVQYLDIGLTLDVQPTIHFDGNVAIKIGLEVSSIVKEVHVKTANGETLAYQIGTRNANTLLELKDGETQVLAGLIKDSERTTSNHVPGLGDIPVVGRLFGSKGNTIEKNEIVLSITPHIVRTQSRPASDTTEFWYGTESQTRSAPLGGNSAGAGGEPTAATSPGGVSYGAGGGTSSVAAAGPSYPTAPRAAPARIDSTAGAPVAAAAAAGAVGGAGVVAAAGADGSVAADAAGARDTAKSAAGSASGKAGVSIEGPDKAKSGEEISVAVRLSSDQPLGRVRAQVRFDATNLQLVTADAGDLAAGGDSPRVDMKPGGVQVDLSGGGNTALQAGSIVNLRFRVVGTEGSTAVSTQVSLVGEDGVAVATSAATPLRIALNP